MRYQQLLILSALGAFISATTVASVAIALAWQRLTTAVASRPAVGRARLLLALRLAPAASGAATAALTLLAFLRYEPASTSEAVGSMLLAIGALGGGTLLAALWHVGQGWRRTRRFLASLQLTAPVRVPGIQLPTWEVDTTFPLIAVTGVWQSRIVVARSVLTEMPPEELRVVLRHECAHALHRDNMARIALTGAPDPLRLVERWLQTERAWRQAAEDAADDFASGGDPRDRVTLASALVRVARMIGEHRAPPLPVLAFHEGESIERRVRRLMQPAASSSSSPGPSAVARFAMIAAGAAGLVAIGELDAVLLGVHGVIEWLVNA